MSESMEDKHKELYIKFLEILREFDDIGCPDDCKCSTCLFSTDIYGADDYNERFDLCEILTKCHSKLTNNI